MIEDKYIGLALAISSSLAIGNIRAISYSLLNLSGTSFVITKKVEPHIGVI